MAFIAKRPRWPAYLDSKWSGIFIVGAGMALRIAALALVGSAPLHNEAPGYREMALELLHHHKFYPYWPPGVPYILLFFHKIFGEGVLVSRVAALTVYIPFSLVLFALVKEVFDRKAANLALLIFAFYPSYVRYSFNPSTEYPAATCLLAIVYFGLRTVEGSSWKHAALTGLFLGALALIRPSALILVPLAPLYFVLRKRSVKLAVVPVLLSGALISVWLVKAYTMTDQFVMINGSNWQNFFLGNNPYIPLFRTWPEGQAESEAGFPAELSARLKTIDRNPPAARDPIYRAAAFHYIVSSPGPSAVRTFNRFCAFLGFPVHRGEPLLKGFHIRGGSAFVILGVTIIDVAFYWAVMIPAILVAFSPGAFSARTGSVPVILGAALAYAASYWISISQPRFSFPVVPLFGVLAAGGIVALAGGARAAVAQALARRRKGAIVAVAFFLCIQIEWILVMYLHLW